MKQVTSEIEILATPEKVWSVLTDFEAYPEWNPFVRKISGLMEVGRRFETVLQFGDRRPVTCSSLLLRMIPRRAISWKGTLGLTGLFDGEYTFSLHSPAPKVVRFTACKRFKGPLSSIVLRSTIERTRLSFETMNRALKARCEA